MANAIEVHIGPDHYKTTVTNYRHEFLADTSVEKGGTDAGPEPTELLLAALGTCKAMTMRMYANRKKWDLASATIKLSAEVVKSEQQQTTYIRCHIELVGDLDESQRTRLLDVAGKCPLHNVLTGHIEIESNLLP